MEQEIPTYYSVSTVAQWCCVTNAAVSNWLRRYTDYPQPAIIYSTPQQDYYGWTADQKREWQDWSRPGTHPAAARRVLPRPGPGAKPRHTAR